MPLHAVLIEPNRTRRAEYERALGADVVLHSTGEPAAEVALPEVQIALIALKQTYGHGLDVGKALKARYPEARVVVYGKLEGGASAQRIRERWGIDTHMPYIPEVSDIAALAGTIRANRQRALAAEAARSVPPRPPTPDDQKAWGELLREPVSKQSLKALLKKDLFGK